MNRFSVKLTFRKLYVILKKITFPSRFATAFSRNRITPVSIAMRTITPIRASNAVTPSITRQFAMFALVSGKTLTFACKRRNKWVKIKRNMPISDSLVLKKRGGRQAVDLYFSVGEKRRLTSKWLLASKLVVFIAEKMQNLHFSTFLGKL